MNNISKINSIDNYKLPNDYEFPSKISSINTSMDKINSIDYHKLPDDIKPNQLPDDISKEDLDIIEEAFLSSIGSMDIPNLEIDDTGSFKFKELTQKEIQELKKFLKM